jgi:NTE family protein
MMGRRTVLLALLALSACPSWGQPAQIPPAHRPRIGLALGGGGARGSAHIGVLKVLEELHIPIDYIAGTSMGSVIGGLYVTGYTPDEIQKVMSKVDWANLFNDSAPRRDIDFRRKQNDYFVPAGLTLGYEKGITLPTGLVAGRKLSFLLNTLTLPAIGAQSFDELPIPFRAVAADARTGEPVALSSGNLARAIRASMAIPIVFSPVEDEGRLLIDGGEAENLPVQTARAMGADIVIAVDVASSSEIPKEAPRSIADVLGRLIDLPLLRNTQESRKLADLVITPDLVGFSSGDFPKGLEIIPKGEEAARAAAQTLSRWSVSPEEYAAWQKAHRVPLPEKPPVIDAVVVEPIPNFDTRRITRVIATKAGLPFNEQVLQADMRRISGMGLWQTVEFRMSREDGKNVLHIRAVPKSWGPTYLSAGLGFEFNYNETSQFEIAALVDATEANRLGADWKTTLKFGTEFLVGSQFYEPLDYTERYFVAPRVSYYRFDQDIFLNQDRIAQYRSKETKIGVDMGLELGHLLSLGQFSVGYERGWGSLRRRIGNPEFPEADYDAGAFVSDLTLDQLDNVWFPHNGYFMNLRYIGSREAFGADTDFNKARILLIGVESLGRWTGTARAMYGDSFGSALPFQELFTLGGFQDLSGRPRDQLLGNTVALGVLTLRYRLTDKRGTIIHGVYVGASAELGNTWFDRTQASFSHMHGAGSLFLATETLLGPLYLAYGNSGGKNSTFYLSLNRSF